MEGQEDSPMQLAVGASLGPYCIERKLGQGGMAEVYSARDTRLGRTVAVKLLRSELACQADFRHRSGGIVRRGLLILGLLGLVCAQLAFGQNSPAITSVVDPYTGGTALCPGDLAAIFGSLGAGAKVTVGGLSAYVVSQGTGSNHITIQIPVNAPLGSVNVVVTLPSGTTAPFPITLTEYAPVLINSAGGSLMSPIHQNSGLPVTANVPANPGEIILVSAIGLGPTNPVVPTGTEAPPNVPTTATPSVSIGANAVSGATAVLAAGRIGIYQVTFAVPQGTPTGSYPLSLSIGVASSNSLTLFVGLAPAGPAIAAVLDYVSLSTSLCPGDLAILSGLNLSANSQVTVGGKVAYIVTPPQNNDQMTIQIPVDAPLGPANVIVNPATGQSSAPVSITLNQYAPQLISSTTGSVISPMHQNSGAPVTSSNPALPNETIFVYAIGLGPTNPASSTGPSSSSPPTATPPTVSLNGTQNPIGTGTAVLVSGQAGIYQVTFNVPANPPTGNSPLAVTIGGVNSNSVTLAIALSSAPPAIDHLANNYSYIAPDLPNYGIAQGSIFDIFGTNLSNGRTVLQSVPLPNSLQGVTVEVTVNGTTTQAILYYAIPSQIGAILPSATPVGDGTITVNNNGKISAAAPIHVVQSGFGILTLNGSGSGPAAAFDVNNQYLGFTNALNPGDYFVLWGTGVGPVSGDETVTQTPANLTNIPFSIEVGGVPAQVYYRGRSQYPGLDQVIGIVPNGVTPGCWVSVVTLSGNISSNFATLPIATTGRTCSDQALGVTASQMQSLLSKNSFNMGALQLQKVGETQFNLANNVNIYDAATAQFISVKPADFSVAALGPSMGSCLVIQGGNGSLPGANIPSTPLDVGPAINITGPSSNAAVQYQGSPEQYAWSSLAVSLWPFDDIPYQSAAGAYIGQIGSGQDLFISNSGGGTFTFDNGSGGAKVGAFSVNLALGSPLLGWPQRSSLQLSYVNRSAGLSLTWSNGDANSFMQISGRSISSAATSEPVQFTCLAPSAAGQFTIPATVLEALPVSLTSLVNPGALSYLQLAQTSFPQSFGAPSLDFTSIQSSVSITIPVFYH